MNFYWEGDNFSYLHLLSVKSFIQHNPDWTCRMYTSFDPNLQENPWPTPEQEEVYTGNNYFSEVSSLGVEIIDINSKIDISEHINPVHKSDILRWKLLSEGGGWSDCDILFTKPLTHLYKNENGPVINNICNIEEEELGGVISYFSSPGYGGSWCCHVIGFYLSCKDNPIFIKLYKTALEALEKFDWSASSGYQDFGRILWEKAFSPKSLECLYPGSHLILDKLYPDVKMANLGGLPLYIYVWTDIDSIYEMCDDKYKHNDVVGIHWYNGHKLARKFTNSFSRETALDDLPDTTIKNVIMSNES